MNEISNYMIYFFIYAFLGWVCETIYCSVLQKHFVNRGFLNGPVCPVYGVGAIIVIIGLWSYRDSMIMVFVVGMILTSILEYLTSVALEKLFHAKWWDYSHYKYNINGRVCLLNSIMFGLLSVVIIEFVHPFILKYLDMFSAGTLKFILFICSATMIGDMFVTVKALNALTLKIDLLETIFDDISKIHAKIKLYENEAKLKIYEEEEEFLRKFKKEPEEILQRIKNLKSGELDFEHRFDEMADDLHDRLKKLRENSFIHRRLLEAFPNMKSMKSAKRDNHLQYIRKLIKNKRK